MRGPYTYIMNRIYRQDIREVIDESDFVAEAVQFRRMHNVSELAFGALAVGGLVNGWSYINNIVSDSDNFASDAIETIVDTLIATPSVAAIGMAAFAAVDAHSLARRAQVRANELREAQIQ